MSVWPFSIAASRALDYRFVLCPELVDQGDLGGRLRNSLKVEDGASIKLSEFSGPGGERYSCAYRAQQIVFNGAAQFDSVGRPLLHIVGLVATVDLGGLPAEVLEKSVDALDPQFCDALSEFLRAKESWTSIPSSAIATFAPSSDSSPQPAGTREIARPPNVVRQEPRHDYLSRGRRRVAAICLGAIGLSLASLALSALLYWDNRDVAKRLRKIEAVWEKLEGKVFQGDRTMSNETTGPSQPEGRKVVEKEQHQPAGPNEGIPAAPEEPNAPTGKRAHSISQDAGRLSDH
ncbi:hypothetical protein [Bradyrhizobium sp. BR 10289]|uniref:hypothetical protein n=1 Tax=Bradyrhizobium sp. BR 10289 TaxID=2749993 RepID=UPI001C6458A9|nr:hypothetical protein [Bradyrhizobium sp. BR 10289]MBW7968878.1 hypothetical protein [Bradyrhizobium sp. BR 10289]